MTLIRKRHIFMKNWVKNEREKGRLSKMNFPQITLIIADQNKYICDNLRGQREKEIIINFYTL